jgi:hypothetical protein
MENTKLWCEFRIKYFTILNNEDKSFTNDRFIMDSLMSAKEYSEKWNRLLEEKVDEYTSNSSELLVIKESDNSDNTTSTVNIRNSLACSTKSQSQNPTITSNTSDNSTIDRIRQWNELSNITTLIDKEKEKPFNNSSGILSEPLNDSENDPFNRLRVSLDNEDAIQNDLTKQTQKISEGLSIRLLVIENDFRTLQKMSDNMSLEFSKKQESIAKLNEQFKGIRKVRKESLYIIKSLVTRTGTEDLLILATQKDESEKSNLLTIRSNNPTIRNVQFVETKEQSESPSKPRPSNDLTVINKQFNQTLIEPTKVLSYNPTSTETNHIDIKTKTDDCLLLRPLVIIDNEKTKTILTNQLVFLRLSYNSTIHLSQINPLTKGEVSDTSPNGQLKLLDCCSRFERNLFFLMKGYSVLLNRKLVKILRRRRQRYRLQYY